MLCNCFFFFFNNNNNNNNNIINIVIIIIIIIIILYEKKDWELKKKCKRKQMSNKLPGWKKYWKLFLRTISQNTEKTVHENTKLKIGIEQTLTSIQQHNHFIFIH